MKPFITTLYVFVLLFQYAVAEMLFHELQFIRITSPTKYQKIKAGEEVKIQYAMQPLVFRHTSHGYAKELNIRFYKQRLEGDKKKISVNTNCSFEADAEKSKTYEQYWTIPSNATPGIGMFEFNEVFQLRSSIRTAREKVRVQIVEN